MPYSKGDGFELRLYESREGRCQVRDYLRSRSKAVRGSAGWLLTRLEREGPALRRPDALRDRLFELRVIVGHEHHRLLYFFSGRRIVVTNAFLKKTDRVPSREIEKAERARADWLSRER